MLRAIDIQHRRETVSRRGGRVGWLGLLLGLRVQEMMMPGRVQTTEYSLQSTEYSLLSTEYSVQSTVYRVQCTVYRVQSKVYRDRVQFK